MSINYPVSTDGTAQFGQPTGTTTLADASWAHAQQHDNLSTLGTTIENIFGTTPGTNLLNPGVKAATDQLFALNSGGSANQTVTKGTFNNILSNNSTFGTPAITGGTANNQVMGTPAITGGTWNNGLLGTPTIVVGSDAQGDLYYRSAGGSATRLGIGANGQYLTTNGTTPSWSGIGTYVYTETVAQGTFANTNANIGTVQIVLVKNSIVTINATCDLREATGETATLHLLDGSGTLTTNGVNTGVGFNSGERMTSAITYAGTLAAGTHTINYQAVNSSGTTTITVGNVQMAIFGIPG